MVAKPSEKEQCESFLFKGSLDWINSVLWFVHKLMSVVAVQVLVLTMLYRSTSSNKNLHSQSIDGIERHIIKVYGSDAGDIINIYKKNTIRAENISLSKSVSNMSGGDPEDKNNSNNNNRSFG